MTIGTFPELMQTLILSSLSQPAHCSCAHTFIFVSAGPPFLCSYFSYFHLCLSWPTVPVLILLIVSYLSQPAHRSCAHTSHTFIFVSAGPPFLCSYFSYFHLCLRRPTVPVLTLLILSSLSQTAHCSCAHTSHTLIFVSASPPFLCSRRYFCRAQTDPSIDC